MNNSQFLHPNTEHDLVKCKIDLTLKSCPRDMGANTIENPLSHN